MVAGAAVVLGVAALMWGKGAARMKRRTMSVTKRRMRRRRRRVYRAGATVDRDDGGMVWRRMGRCASGSRMARGRVVDGSGGRDGGAGAVRPKETIAGVHKGWMQHRQRRKGSSSISSKVGGDGRRGGRTTGRRKGRHAKCYGAAAWGYRGRAMAIPSSSCYYV